MLQTAVTCGAQVLGQLHPRRADRSRRAVDQDALAGSEVRPRQAGHGEDGAVAHRGRLLERHAGRLGGDRGTLADAQVLGVRPEPVGVHAEDLVADRELSHGRPDSDHDPGELASEDGPPGSPEPGEEPDEPRPRRPEAAVGPVHGRGVHLHEHLVVGRDRPLDVDDTQHLGPPYSVFTTARITPPRCSLTGPDRPRCHHR